MSFGDPFFNPFAGDFQPFLIAFLASAIGAYPIYRLLLALKSRQTVSQYAPEGHQIKQGTPTMGGLIVAFGFLIFWIFPLWIWQSPVTMGSVYVGETLHVQELSFPLLFLGFAVIGFVDDFVVPRVFPGKRGLGWKQKILMQLVVAFGCSYLLFPYHSLTLFGTIFLVLFFSNAYNFSDGLDALASLLLIGFAGGLIFIYPIAFGPLMALLGAILPFLYLNKPKAKLFMGDVGSLPIGAVLGAAVAEIVFPRIVDFPRYTDPVHTAINPGPPSVLAPWWICVPVLIASGMMIVELVPVPLQILSVKLRKKKLFSFTPIHHAFERKGWPEQKVVAVFAACQVALSLLAILIAHLGHSLATRNDQASSNPNAIHLRRPEGISITGVAGTNQSRAYSYAPVNNHRDHRNGTGSEAVFGHFSVNLLCPFCDLCGSAVKRQMEQNVGKEPRT